MDTKLLAHTNRARLTRVIVATVAALCFAGLTAYAALPLRTVPPAAVPMGTLAGQTSIDVLSVSAFTRAINQARGTNAVLQHLVFAAGQSTLWHTHPGPNLVLMVDGSLTLTDEHCDVATYKDGEGFATGLKNHLAVAGPNGADFYTLYLLPGDAEVLREPPAGVSAPPPNCANQ